MGWLPGYVRYFDGQTTAPTVGDDENDGYQVGDLWIDETNDFSYVCLDNSVGAAVWQLIGDAQTSLVTSKAEWDQNGFENRTDSTISFTDGTRTFSIQPTGTSFNYWVAGIMYSSTGDTVVITDVEGIHVIYYVGDTLTALANPTRANISTAIRTTALVCFLYWDSSAAEAIYVGEERHGKSMAPATHALIHFRDGLAYITGLALTDILVDEDGSSNTHVQFGVGSGEVADEDIYQTVDAVAAATGLPLYYMLGASAEWQREIVAGFSIRTFDGTSGTRLAWNEFTGGAWQLTQVGNGNFVLYHVFATTEKDKPMICIMGQGEYATKTAARIGAKTEIQSLLLDDILFPEIHPVGTIIFETKDAYTNAYNARIVSTADGDDYVDWRSEAISRVELTTSNHGDLSGLGADDHTQYWNSERGLAFILALG